MDYSTIRPKTYILKVNIHCPECQKRVDKVLKKTSGVRSFRIDAEAGKVIVTGVLDPAALIRSLAKKGKSAEVLECYHHTLLPHEQQALQQKPAQDVGSHSTRQQSNLQHLSKSLSQVEITHSRSFRMSFKEPQIDHKHKGGGHGSDPGASNPRHRHQEGTNWSSWESHGTDHRNLHVGAPQVSSSCHPPPRPPCACSHGMVEPPRPPPPPGYPASFDDHSGVCSLM